MEKNVLMAWMHFSLFGSNAIPLGQVFVFMLSLCYLHLQFLMDGIFRKVQKKQYAPK